MRPRLDRAGVALAIESSPFKPEALVDEGHVRQVLVNLVGNAIDALDGRPEPSVSLRSETIGREVLVTVRDNGPGIPEANRERIFEPFFTTKKKGKGTGLGLAICRSLIEAQGGRIELHGNAGEGTAFTIALPSSRKATTSRIDLQPVRAKMSKVTEMELALVVSAGEQVCELCQVFLSRLNTRVEIVREVPMASQLTGATDFDLVILEHTVRQSGDGLVLAENILRNRPEMKNRVMMLCTEAQRAQLREYPFAAALSLIEHPLTVEKFVDALLRLEND
jgi:hypothetical protein